MRGAYIRKFPEENDHSENKIEASEASENKIEAYEDRRDDRKCNCCNHKFDSVLVY